VAGNRPIDKWVVVVVVVVVVGVTVVVAGVGVVSLVQQQPLRSSDKEKKCSSIGGRDGRSVLLVTYTVWMVMADGIVATMYGVRHFSMIGGLTFLFHQVNLKDGGLRVGNPLLGPTHR